MMSGLFFNGLKFCAFSLLIIMILSSCDSNTKKSFDEEGRLLSVLRYKDGKLHGFCEWYHVTGKLQMTSEYAFNTLSGKQVRYYPTGVIQSESFYKDNMLDSVYHYYSMNGKLNLIETYKSDTLNGLNQRLYDNGKIMVDGFYQNGMMHGNWLFYDVSGAVIGKAEFNKGTGIQKGWHSNGILGRVTHYVNNLRHGIEEYYDYDGQLKMTQYYENGDLVKEEVN